MKTVLTILRFLMKWERARIIIIFIWVLAVLIGYYRCWEKTDWIVGIGIGILADIFGGILIPKK